MNGGPSHQQGKSGDGAGVRSTSAQGTQTDFVSSSGVASSAVASQAKSADVDMRDPEASGGPLGASGGGPSIDGNVVG